MLECFSEVKMFKKAKIACQGGEVLSLAVVNTAAPSAKLELENMASAAKFRLLSEKGFLNRTDWS